MSEVLSGKKREKTGKVATKEVRRSGKIPAVLYGLKDNFSFSVCPNNLSDILKAKGQNSLIDLDLEGDKKRKVLLKDYQSHPLRERWVHVDFLEVDTTKMVKVSVDVNLIGKSAGEKMGGLVNQVIKVLHIECLPADIPQFVEVDTTGVELGQVLHVSDLSLPDKVKVLHKPSDAIVSVYLEKAKEEKSEDVAAEEDESVDKSGEPAVKADSTKKES
jgi:large subunit ribosomal protein L25